MYIVIRLEYPSCVVYQVCWIQFPPEVAHLSVILLDYNLRGIMLPCRSERVQTVDVLCYRDYTREGKRVVSHSLLLEGVKLHDKMATDGNDKINLCEV